MYADLHTHTNYSDGNVEVEDLVKLAKEKGTKVLAIADHDTLFHYDRIKEACDQYGIKSVWGIELSCYDFSVNKKVHILGLGFKDYPVNVEAKGKQALAGRDNYHKKMIKMLNEKGYDITYEDAKKHSKYNIVFKRHLFDAIVEKYPEMKDASKYRELFLNTGFSNADLEMDYIPVDEGIEAIHKDGGIAILAHPCLYSNYPEIEKYVAYGLDGLEVSHPEMKAEDYVKTKEIVEKFDLIATGGSDFHDFLLTPDMGEYGITEGQYKVVEEKIKFRNDK